MLLLAWTAAFAILIGLAIIVVLVSLRIIIVCFTTGRTRQVLDFLFAILGLALLTLLFWF